MIINNKIHRGVIYDMETNEGKQEGAGRPAEGGWGSPISYGYAPSVGYYTILISTGK